MTSTNSSSNIALKNNDETHDTIIFYVLLIFMIPSLISMMYLFIQFGRIRVLRTRVNNHLLLLLLIVNFIQIGTELPLNLFLLHTGTVAIQTYWYCIFWNIYNFSLVAIGLFALAYGCIQRYILIFHRNFFNRHKILLHYLPFSISIVYPTVFYIYVVAVYPCVNKFSYNHALCGRPCYEYQQSFGAIDWIGNLTVTVAIVIIANIILVLRILIQKISVGQRSLWRKNRRLFIQLLAVSGLYIVVWTPILVCFLMVIYAPNTIVVTLSVDYLNYYQYLGMLLYPFICLIGLKEVQDTLKEHIRWVLRRPRNRNRIQQAQTMFNGSTEQAT